MGFLDKLLGRTPKDAHPHDHHHAHDHDHDHPHDEHAAAPAAEPPAADTDLTES